MKDDIGHSNEVLVSVIPENKDVRIGLAGTGFFFGQHNVEVAIAIEVGSIDRSVTTGEDLRHNGWSECSVAEIQRRTKMIWRTARVRSQDQIEETIAIDIAQLHIVESSRRRVINRGSERAVTVILQNLYDTVDLKRCQPLRSPQYRYRRHYRCQHFQPHRITMRPHIASAPGTNHCRDSYEQ